ncbi:hypothetical protein C8R45DRAFT_939280 [Mycena sanguinolenta]|nr:hypothetical protein C8R45DRAFT_939280 [Mycena sanguinolenta]
MAALVIRRPNRFLGAVLLLVQGRVKRGKKITRARAHIHICIRYAYAHAHAATPAICTATKIFPAPSIPRPTPTPIDRAETETDWIRRCSKLIFSSNDKYDYAVRVGLQSTARKRIGFEIDDEFFLKRQYDYALRVGAIPTPIDAARKRICSKLIMNFSSNDKYDYARLRVGWAGAGRKFSLHGPQAPEEKTKFDVQAKSRRTRNAKFKLYLREIAVERVASDGLMGSGRFAPCRLSAEV